MKVTKTVMEWNNYITLANKKLDKAENDLKKGMFIVTTKGEYGLEINKERIDKDVKEIEALYDKVKKLTSNIEKVKMARQKFNFETMIEIAGEKINIATALNRYNNRADETAKLNMFLHGYDRLNNELDNANRTYEYNKEKLNREATGNNRQATKAELELVASRIDDFTPIQFDPLNLKDLYKEKKENLDNFLSEVNAKINIANATNSLELDLDEEK
ncbi:MAG: hypothetical protein ACRCXT_15425 [Paraclostridium sp.]